MGRATFSLHINDTVVRKLTHDVMVESRLANSFVVFTLSWRVNLQTMLVVLEGSS